MFVLLGALCALAPASAGVHALLHEPEQVLTATSTAHVRRTLSKDDGYWRLAESYFDGPRISRCLKRQKATGWRGPPMSTCVNKNDALFAPNVSTKPTVTGTCPMQTLGVEGVGHHMLNTIDPALCGGASTCFGVSSLPNDNVWRKDGQLISTRDFVLQELLKERFFRNNASRYVVLLRDPLAAKSSAMGRFARVPTRAVLELEAAAMTRSLEMLARLVEQLPCERTLFLGYEALLSAPDLHAGALAAFLGVEPSDTRVTDWLGSLGSCPSCEAMARQLQQSGSVPTEAVACDSVPEAELKVGRQVMNVSALARLQPPCQSPRACEEQIFDFMRTSLEPQWSSFVDAGAVPRRTAYSGQCFRHAPAPRHAPGRHASGRDSSRQAKSLKDAPFKPPLADVAKHVCDRRVRRACDGDGELCTESEKLQALPDSMFECADQSTAQPSIIRHAESEPCSRLSGMRFVEGEPSEMRCEGLVFSHCRAFGYVAIFDGLGHYFNKLRTLLIRERDQGIFRSYGSFFEEFVGRSAVYVESMTSRTYEVRDQQRRGNLSTNRTSEGPFSLYCHQKQLATADSFSSSAEFWERQYECYEVPPLDRWFNLQSDLVDQDEERCVQLKVREHHSPDGNSSSRWHNFLRAQYWDETPDAPMVKDLSCGRTVARDETWQLALHLRLGDLIAPVLVDNGADKGRAEIFSERVAHGIDGLKRALQLLSHVQSTLHNASAHSSFRSLVITDSPFASVKQLLHTAGVHLSVERTFQDELTSYTDVKARFPSGESEGGEGKMQLSFMSDDANPLVALHCLAAADVLLLPAAAHEYVSSFALMAASLSRGSVISSAGELAERVSRVEAAAEDGGEALAAAFVQSMLLPRGTFEPEEEDGAYAPFELPGGGRPTRLGVSKRAAAR